MWWCGDIWTRNDVLMHEFLYVSYVNITSSISSSPRDPTLTWPHPHMTSPLHDPSLTWPLPHMAPPSHDPAFTWPRPHVMAPPPHGPALTWTHSHVTPKNRSGLHTCSKLVVSTWENLGTRFRQQSFSSYHLYFQDALAVKQAKLDITHRWRSYKKHNHIQYNQKLYKQTNKRVITCLIYWACDQTKSDRHQSTGTKRNKTKIEKCLT